MDILRRARNAAVAGSTIKVEANVMVKDSITVEELDQLEREERKFEVDILRQVPQLITENEK